VIDVPTADGTQFLQPLLAPRHVAPGPPAIRSGHTPSIASVPNPTMASTDDNRFTEAAEHVLNTVGERTVWQGTPSLLYLIKPALGWVVFIAVVTIGLSQLALTFDWGWLILALAILALLKIGAGWMRLHNTRYRLSSQRLEKTEGLLSRTTVTVELLNIKRAVITEPFPWRLFGLGDLELDAATGEHWKLYGIRGATTVRDLIHSSSGIGGQLWDQRRFGN
jgi:membrane protein implicated in regulation of membrane protease activity